MSRYRHKTKAALNDMRKRVLALHATQSPIYQSSYRHLHQHQRQDYGDKLKAPQQLQRSPSPPSAMEHVLLEKDRLGKASATFTRPSRDDMENNNRRYEDSQDEHKPRPNDNLSRWVSFVEGEALFYYTPLATVQCLDMIEFRLRGIAPSSFVKHFRNSARTVDQRWPLRGNAPHPTKSLRFSSVSVISTSVYQDPTGSVG
ncbi:hypothetical protein Gpo141_00009869 [Globisporangium polare]